MNGAHDATPRHDGFDEWKHADAASASDAWRLPDPLAANAACIACNAAAGGGKYCEDVSTC